MDLSEAQEAAEAHEQAAEQLLAVAIAEQFGGVPVDAYLSLAASRGVSLAAVMSAVVSGDLAAVVALPPPRVAA